MAKVAAKKLAQKMTQTDSDQALSQAANQEPKKTQAAKAAKLEKPDRAKTDRTKPDRNVESTPVVNLGEYAHSTLLKQYRRLVKQEAGVLQDTDPEALHQMRVATRRLRTALQVFAQAVDLPKPACERQVQALTRVLGKLRDLDVQIAALRDDYTKRVPKAEQAVVHQAIERLRKQRKRAFAEVEAALTGAKYRNLKTAYELWLEQPNYMLLAELPLTTVLPDLLSPLLSKLLLHSGWQVAAEAASTETGVLLHELRKTCKQARYQAEFFTEFYGKRFQEWVEELKQLQENLGIVQDTHVLLHILTDGAVTEAELAERYPELHRATEQQKANALSNWDQLRAKYVSAEFRHSLYQMILSPEQITD